MPKKSKNTTTGISRRLEELLPPRRHEPGADVCQIIDGMGLAYAAHHAYSKLSFKGNSTAIIFGVPQMIRTALQRWKTDKLIVCWDGDRNAKRIELLPGYKAHRDKKRDPRERKLFLAEIKILRKLLHRMGIPQAYDKKVEGDDMLYFVHRKMSKLYRTIIVSGDKDFHQLVNHDTTVFNPRTGDITTTFAFKGQYPVEVPQFVDYLCLVGDDSDDIPGYYGIGPARAGKFFEQFYSIREYLRSNKEFPGMADKDSLRDIFRRNRRLIDLELFCNKYYPKEYTPKWFRDSQHPTFDEIRYRSLCIRYNLKTMLYPKFMEPFKNI